jgi:hypothetical protein
MPVLGGFSFSSVTRIVRQDDRARQGLVRVPEANTKYRGKAGTTGVYLNPLLGQAPANPRRFRSENRQITRRRHYLVRQYMLAASRFIALTHTGTVSLAIKSGDLVLICVAAVRANPTVGPDAGLKPVAGLRFVEEDRGFD